MKCILTQALILIVRAVKMKLTNIMNSNLFLSHLKTKKWLKMTTNRSIMKINKQMLEEVVMVEELLEETGLPPRGNRQQEDALLEIQWTLNDRQPRILQFTARQGLQVQLPNNAGAGEYLSLFLTDEFFYLLVEQTNLYAAQYKASNPNLPPNSRANSWVETTRNEMKKFLALSFLLGVVRKPEVSDYWTTNPLLKGSIFNSVMPKNRFQSILQFLHFAVSIMQMTQIVIGYAKSDLFFNTLFPSSRALTFQRSTFQLMRNYFCGKGSYCSSSTSHSREQDLG